MRAYIRACVRVCVKGGGACLYLCVVYVCEYMCFLSDRVFAKFGYELITCSNAVIGER